MKYTQVKNLPPALLSLLTEGHAPHASRYGVNSLNGSPMQRQLKIRHYDNLIGNPLDNIWMMYGRLLHDKLEHHAGKNALTEERLTLVLPNGKTIVGIPDYYDDADGGTIWDYKFCSTYSGKDGEVKPEWSNQLNVYAYLLQKCAGFPVHNLKLAMMFRDWSATKAKTTPDYPEKIKVVDVPLAPMLVTEAYINKRLAEHAKAESLSDDEIAKQIPCTNDERWMSEQVFAVMKGDNKKATKLFADKNLADSHVVQLGKGYSVVTRPQVYRKCDEYCELRQVCPLYKGERQ